jgi:RNA polymerase sigma-70 factor (ECF subfamily)
MARLHANHAAELLRFLLGFARGERQTAEDMLQETMLRTWSHIESVPRQDVNARRWLFTVARRIAIDAARARQTRPTEVSLLEVGRQAMTEDNAEALLAARAVMGAFARLKEEHQVVLSELHFKGNSVVDIAQRLGVPPGTVKSRAFYGMRSIRDALCLTD